MTKTSSSSFSIYREKFFNIYADFYEEFEMSGLCGWIDALLYLYPLDPSNKAWTQQSISTALKEFFPNNTKYPTSVSSINRMIKINEEYGTIKKEGSHKLGYTYHPLKGSDLLFTTFYRFIEKNDRIITKFEELNNEDLKEDKILHQSVKEQIEGLKFYNQMMQHALDWGLRELNQIEKYIGED